MDCKIGTPYKLDLMVSILGSHWNIIICTEKEDSRLEATNGFVDWTSRKIYAADWEGQDTSLENPFEFTMKILRHEIIHAFMFESGLGDDWQHQSVGHDETTIDWLAIQFPKIEGVINEVENTIMLNEQRKK